MVVSLFLLVVSLHAAIDIGNTGIKVGLFKADKMLMETEVRNEELLNYLMYKKVENLIISTVGGMEGLVIQLKKVYPHLIWLDTNIPLPIGIKYKSKETLGVDRIAAAIGAVARFKGPLAIIDAGSCITCDLINNEGLFIGGIISPGLQMRLKAMHNFTANLPLLKLREPNKLVGESTEEGMLSGAVNGARQEIIGIIQQYFLQFPDLKVIICGGDRFFFDKLNEFETFVLPNLVLEGLYAILKFNDKV